VGQLPALQLDEMIFAKRYAAEAIVLRWRAQDQSVVSLLNRGALENHDLRGCLAVGVRYCSDVWKLKLRHLLLDRPQTLLERRIDQRIGEGVEGPERELRLAFGAHQRRHGAT